jgi:hypothetical protein
MVLVLLLQGQPAHGLLTDRRIILRESSGSCGFPLNLCCICFKVCCGQDIIQYVCAAQQGSQYWLLFCQ